MSFTSLCDDILVTLYQENELGNTDMIPFTRLVEKYSLQTRPGWLLEAQQDLKSRGLIAAPSNSLRDEMAAGRITGAGMRQVEDRWGTKNGVGTVIAPHIQSVVEMTLPNNLSEPVADTSSSILAVNSTDWTGLQHRLSENGELAQHIKSKIAELDREIDTTTMSNHDRARLKSISVALLSLVDSPEPEWSAILALLNSPAFTAALNVASLAQLIIAMMIGS